MIAYRVRLIGTSDTYLVTSKQRYDIELAMEQGGTSIVRIGENVVRANSIRSLTETLVDLDSCPAYFQKQVQTERGNAKSPVGQQFKRLPTKWILFDENRGIIAVDSSMMEIERISKALIGARESGKEQLKTFFIAKCHYSVGSDGVQQFHTNLQEVPEALRCVPNEDFPKQARIVQIYRYGVAQLNKR